MSTTDHRLPLEFTTVGPTTHTTPRHGASRWIRTCLGGLFAVVLAFFVLEEAVAQVLVLSVEPAEMVEAEGMATVSVSVVSVSTGGVTRTFDREITLTFTGTGTGIATEGDDYTVSAKTLTLMGGRVL